MQDFTNSIRKAIIDKNWFAALFLALCMPDICGVIETPNEENGIRYKRWFNENLAIYTSMFSAEDAWCFRCSCLHQGVDTDTRMVIEKVHFITPPPRANIVHMNNFKGILQMQIDIFCNDIATAIDTWYENIAKKDPDMRTRTQGLIKIYGSESLKHFISFE